MENKEIFLRDLAIARLKILGQLEVPKNFEIYCVFDKNNCAFIRF